MTARDSGPPTAQIPSLTDATRVRSVQIKFALTLPSPIGMGEGRMPPCAGCG
jgi:hypothetical protein